MVGSPDKISPPSFIRLLKSFFPDHEIGEMHSLMSEESMSLYVSDFTSQFPDGIFSYYAKGAVNKDPMICLPKSAVEKSDIVIWFDLYATEPKVLKDPEGKLNTVIDEWKKYIQKLS